MKLRQYTAVGKRVDALCGPQHRIAAALGLDRSQVSRKFRDEIDLTVNELIMIADYFDIPIWMFFTQGDFDDEVFAGCYRMFLYDPIALDRIIEAFNTEHKSLTRFGEQADAARRARRREKDRKGKRNAVSGS